VGRTLAGNHKPFNEISPKPPHGRMVDPRVGFRDPSTTGNRQVERHLGIFARTGKGERTLKNGMTGDPDTVIRSWPPGNPRGGEREKAPKIFHGENKAMRQRQKTNSIDFTISK